MEYLDLVGVGRIHFSFSSASSLTAPSTASLAAHGLMCLVWGGLVSGMLYWGSGWNGQVGGFLVGICCILASLGVVPASETSLVLSIGAGPGAGVYGGWNSILWLVRCVVTAPRLIVGYPMWLLVVSYFQLVEAILQHLHLSLCCCCTLCVTNNRLCNGWFIHCGLCGIECRPIYFLS